MRSSTAIVAMGVTQTGINLGITPRELRARAVDLALAEAGLPRDAIDGYIHCASDREDVRYMGLSPNFSFAVQSGGATPAVSLMLARSLIESGQAEMVACVYGQAPSTRLPGQAGWGAFAYGYPALYGFIGAAATHALHARRHIHLYGTTSEQMGAVAVTQRNYASVRPGTLGYGKPITLEDHQASPMICDPFRRLDCTRDTDGGVCMLVTTAERATTISSRPIYLLGGGSGHNIANWHKGLVYENHDNIAPAAARAFAEAGMSLADIDMCQLYDPFTISPIMQLEAYGVVKEGQGGAFYADGGAGPDGAMPTNTGGGQLSGFYTTGFTPLIEAVRQLRGEGGAGQLAKAETALVSGHGLNGGVHNSWSHATLILGNDA